MTQPDEISRIEEILRQSFGEQVRVTADPFVGIRVAVVSEAFTRMTPRARRERVQALVPGAEVVRFELLTPDEARFAEKDELGIPPVLAELPLWPEALANGRADEITVRFPSEDYGTLPSPVVSTFYSLRGGVGRSTALAHAARIIAAQGLKVLCIDMDLEAPGLASLFDVEDRVTEGMGVVPLLAAAEVNGEIYGLDEHVLQVTEDAGLFLLPAGCPGAEYARLLSHLDPSAWYGEDEINPLRLLVEAVSGLAEQPDVVLIDSRTGISPLAAPLLFDVSDINVIAFYPHPQAKAGTRALTRALLAANSRRSVEGKPCTPEIRFLVSPVPATPEVRALYAERAQEWIKDWLSVARNTAGGPAFEALEEITQVIGYQETLAVSDSVMRVQGAEDFTVVADWITGLVEPRDALGEREHEVPEPSKAEVLTSLQFAGETAENQDLEELNGTFLSTADVGRALDLDTVVVIGRKGTGKTAVFRRLAETPTAVVVTGPPGLDTHRSWTPDADVYGTLEADLRERGLEWRQAWPVLVGLAIRQYLSNVPQPNWASAPIGVPAAGGDYLKTDLLNDVRALLSDSQAPLLVGEWLQEIDRSLDGDHVLLFDALDTGFGNSDNDRRRRNDGVAGLLTAVGSLGPQLRKLHFKILLREDIWRESKVPNKSHLSARSARLSWSNKTDYLRIVIKQAWRSQPFRQLVTARLNKPDFRLEKTPVEYWPEEFVRNAWVILASERVSGGRTAYTDNWVWSRLADANGDHAPRALAQMMTAAVGLERGFEAGNSYSRSIIRPRALVESLDEVSESALDALQRDEFPELDPLLRRLRQIGSTPFATEQLEETSPDLVKLARDVGLLEEVPGPREKVERYRVPEMYRKALNMTRKGQA
ncbi:CobQ/CobB/MinD/ParA family nucleotide binding protein [Streptomyces sp. 840.1]|uniref:tyrosine-protein kinase family protein n=1 Tax=Streptomyces sp. 840.1 TaxID=2485152 RepID=UPI000F49779D|nr:ParA family protein [Streptomyces sp. 840.1]ROQ65863.1 CobQ/CobB/MinD/ParA family nucleotide binding protein [Streptomyces sp. 840.1]